MKKFKVEIIKENALSTLLFGSSKLPINKMEACLNDYGRRGWDVAFQIIEHHRLFFFWSREAVIITFSIQIDDILDVKSKNDENLNDEQHSKVNKSFADDILGF